MISNVINAGTGSLAGILGGTELLIVAAIVLLFFGGKKIPELFRGAGRGVGEFNKGLKESLPQPSETPETAPPTTTNSNTPA